MHPLHAAAHALRTSVFQRALDVLLRFIAEAALSAHRSGAHLALIFNRHAGHFRGAGAGGGDGQGVPVCGKTGRGPGGSTGSLGRCAGVLLLLFGEYHEGTSAGWQGGNGHMGHPLAKGKHMHT